jgi:hypothetical protein
MGALTTKPPNDEVDVLATSTRVAANASAPARTAATAAKTMTMAITTMAPSMRVVTEAIVDRKLAAGHRPPSSVGMDE